MPTLNTTETERGLSVVHPKKLLTAMSMIYHQEAPVLASDTVQYRETAQTKHQLSQRGQKGARLKPEGPEGVRIGCKEAPIHKQEVDGWFVQA